MTAVLGLLGTLLAALLPVLVEWLTKATADPAPLDTMSERHDDELSDLSTALASGDAVDVGAAWARHDRVLLHEGLTPSKADRGGGEQVRDPQRDLAGDMGRLGWLDDEAPGDGAVAARSPGKVRAPRVKPTLDWTW